MNNTRTSWMAGLGVLLALLIGPGAKLALAQKTTTRPAVLPAMSEKAFPEGPMRLSQKVVMIGRVPYVKLEDMMKQCESLMGFLKNEMGVKEVRLVTSKDYQGVLDSLSRGTIDFAWLGPVAYVMGKDAFKLVPLVKTKRKEGSVYRGVIITRKDSAVKTLSDIRGKVIAFVDPESASGYMYPLHLLKECGIIPVKDGCRIVFLKKHDAVITSVIEGKADVGGCLEAALTGHKDKSQIEELKILGKTDEICSDVLVCREDCPGALRDRFQKALLKAGNENQGGKKMNVSVELFGFLPVDDKDFQSVRDVLEDVNSQAK